MPEHFGFTGGSPFDASAVTAGFDGLGEGSQRFLDGFARELLQGQESLSLNGDLFAGLPQPAFPASPQPPTGTGAFDYAQVMFIAAGLKRCSCR